MPNLMPTHHLRQHIIHAAVQQNVAFSVDVCVHAKQLLKIMVDVDKDAQVAGQSAWQRILCK